MWKTHAFRRALGPLLKQLDAEYDIPAEQTSTEEISSEDTQSGREDSSSGTSGKNTAPSERTYHRRLQEKVSPEPASSQASPVAGQGGRRIKSRCMKRARKTQTSSSDQELSNVIARMLVKVWVTSDALVPKSIVLRQMGGHRNSWTVPVYLLRPAAWTPHMHDVPADSEDQPPADGNPHPIYGPHVTTETRFQQRLQTWLQQNGMGNVGGGGGHGNNGGNALVRANAVGQFVLPANSLQLPDRGQINYQHILREQGRIFSDGIVPTNNVMDSPMQAWTEMVSDDSNSSASMHLEQGSAAVMDLNIQSEDFIPLGDSSPDSAIVPVNNNIGSAEVPTIFMFARTVMFSLQQPSIYVGTKSLLMPNTIPVSLLKFVQQKDMSVLSRISTRRVARRLCFDATPTTDSKKRKSKVKAIVVPGDRKESVQPGHLSGKGNTPPPPPPTPVKGYDLSNLLTFDPESIEPTAKASEASGPNATQGQLQQLKALLSSSIETLVEDTEGIKNILEDLQPHLPVTLQVKLWPVVTLSAYRSRVTLARQRIGLRHAQLPLKADIADKCQRLNEKKAALDAKTDTSTSTAELEILRKELEDLEERVRVTKQLIQDKEALIARSHEEAEGLKAELKTDLAEIRALNKQLVTGQDEDDEAEIAEVDRVRASRPCALEAFL
ncbi:hypothetical protein QYE76_044632 [Lolium multiflorum]|uniref:DUF1409 domain-containing protein n=1 Tax=Lolium multiflorum TaxID=4521 RepID=A0AAD8TJ45_LOLMU|nr:hypothetical protein QYE76_044632 [Lolium multiflorum]